MSHPSAVPAARENLSCGSSARFDLWYVTGERQ